jgi:uncharacterized membrane protein YkvA (DUF1232 family)
VKPADQRAPRLNGRRHPLVRLAGTVRRLPNYVNLAQALAREGALSPAHKALLGLGIAYVASPVDLIPGVIPVLGQLDDLAALLLGLKQALAACPAEVARAHVRRAGLAETALDADLRTIAVVGVWIVGRTATAGARLLRGSLRLLGHTALGAARLTARAAPTRGG